MFEIYVSDFGMQKLHAGKMQKRSFPPLTAEEPERKDDAVAEIHTSASDGGASSMSMLWEPESGLLPCLECPEWVRE